MYLIRIILLIYNLHLRSLYDKGNSVPVLFEAAMTKNAAKAERLESVNTAQQG